jgi:hypothetical protein
MGKKKAEGQEKEATQATAGEQDKKTSSMDMKTRERLTTIHDKVMFCADMVATARLTDLTDDGKEGFFWILNDIAQDIERVTA